MANRSTSPEPEEINALPSPCADCASNGGNWAHRLRHSEFGGQPITYPMAARCHCARGQRLAAMDSERTAGRVPAGSKTDPAAETRREAEKWARWKREAREERERHLGPAQA